MSFLTKATRKVGDFVFMTCAGALTACAMALALTFSLLPFAFYAFILYLAYLVVIHFTGG